MKTIIKTLKELGFEVKDEHSYFIFVSNDNYSIKVRYTYKGYEFEFTEWVSSNFGRTKSFEVGGMKSKDIVDYLKKNVRVGK